MPRQTNIQVRRGTASDWNSSNPTLAQGEPGFETDTKKMKIGNGSTAWNSLPYFSVDGGNLEGSSPSPTSTPIPPTPTSTPIPPTPTPTSGAQGVFTLSGAGTSSVNGCYTEGGTYNGKPYYTNGTRTVWYDSSQEAWFISQGVEQGPPDYIGYGVTVPDNFILVDGQEPVPSISPGC